MADIANIVGPGVCQTHAKMEVYALKSPAILHAVAQLSTVAIFVNKGFGAPQTHVKMEVLALKKWIISHATALPSLLVTLVVSSNPRGVN